MNDSFSPVHDEDLATTHDGSDDAIDPFARSSAGRALRLLGAVAQRPMLLVDLATELSLPKATVHRICAQLMAAGYLGRHVDERYFVAGPALRELALDALNHDSQRGIRQNLLNALVAQVGETCNFTTLDGASVIYLDRVEAPWPWRVTLVPGVHVPLHCSSSGKLFLALMPPAQREALMAQLPMDRLTASTIVELPLLRTECEKIAAQGYALDVEEFIPGLIGLAVPVLDNHGRARAGISMHAPVARMDVETVLSKLPALRDTAAKMRSLL